VGFTYRSILQSILQILHIKVSYKAYGWPKSGGGCIPMMSTNSSWEGTRFGDRDWARFPQKSMLCYSPESKSCGFSQDNTIFCKCFPVVSCIILMITYLLSLNEMFQWNQIGADVFREYTIWWLNKVNINMLMQRLVSSVVVKALMNIQQIIKCTYMLHGSSCGY
jgi:hypothetical protein